MNELGSMNDILKRASADLIEWVKQGAGFVQEQAPLAAREYLRYSAVLDWIWFSVGVFGIAVAAIVLPQWWRLTQIDEAVRTKREEKAHIVSAIMWPVLVVSVMVVSFVGSDLVRLYCAPRIYILDALRQMMK